MIGIIAAMEEEMTILREALDCSDANVVCGISFYEGSIGNQDVVLCTSGVGKVNAAMATTILIESYECSFIINTGIAGGITKVETKDIILGKELAYWDIDATAFGYAVGQVPGMPKKYLANAECILKVKQILKKLGLSYKEATIYSGDSFVSSLEQVSKVNINIPCIAEMEGAAVAQVCTRAGVDFLVLRFVSDLVGKENQIKDYQAFESEMARRSSTICVEIIKNLE
ncbi:MAG: 5'-methylthioadenosine/adenosylhomocysteine nucleosidase [Anaeroplasmataceae bacterium]|nr:5'-methylthioadenosine/adenosylhomocysteine nucleosidase [Anaeroplasmataceae bacterium]